MRIFINTFGSRGDVQPFLILGKALKDKGHRVIICTGCRFEKEVFNNGLEYGFITNEAYDLLDSNSTILEDSLGILGFIKVSLKLMKAAKPINKKMIQNAWDAAKEFNPEVVIYHPKALGAVSIAEKFNAPAIMISLIPMLGATKAFPVPGMPNLKLGGWYNLLTYKLVLMGYNACIDELNNIRTNQMGLAKLPRYTGVATKSDKSTVPNIHAISAHVLNRPKDWPPIYTMSGYLVDKQDKRYTPNPDLIDFLAKGPPPVYIGFGSMSGSNSERLTKTIINALINAKVRGIIATGWGGLSAAEHPNTIFTIQDAPHAWLFPKMAAVIHHGGAGTTAAGLRAGVPSIICPFMGDQPFWADQIVKLGVGLKVSSQKKLTSKELAKAIIKVTSDSRMQTASVNLAKKLQMEDGVTNVVNIITNIISER